MFFLFDVIFVPLGDFHDDIRGPVGNSLATKAGLWGDAGSFVEFVEFGIGGFIAGFEALLDDDMAGGACADAAAGVVEPSFDALGNVENAAGQAVVAVGDFFGIEPVLGSVDVLPSWGTACRAPTNSRRR